MNSIHFNTKTAKSVPGEKKKRLGSFVSHYRYNFYNRSDAKRQNKKEKFELKNVLSSVLVCYRYR